MLFGGAVVRPDREESSPRTYGFVFLERNERERERGEYDILGTKRKIGRSIKTK